MDDVVTIKVYSTRIEAEIAKGILDSHGIRSMMSTDDMAGWRSDLTLTNGVRLLVRKENYAVSKQLLSNQMNK
jgi:hypothetical protein